MRAAHMTAPPPRGRCPTSTPLDHLDHLESEAIHIFREVAGEFERPVMLFSRRQGLGRHAAPGGQGVRARARCRSRCCTSTPGTTSPRCSTTATPRSSGSGVRLVVANVQDYIDDGRLRERPDGTRNPLQTVPLLDAIEADKFDAVFGGGRRDEEKARAKERVFSLRDEFGAVGPAPPAARAVGPLQRQARARRARARVPAVQLDRARRLALHRARGHRAARPLLRPRARGLRARRHVAGARRVGQPDGRGRRRPARSATARSAT